MKKGLLLILLLVVVICILLADDYMLPGPFKRQSDFVAKERFVQPTRPDSCIVEFSINPVSYLFSYYDYMIGGYNSLPLCVQPNPTYGGYFATFHGKRTATGQRRVFYTYISDNGVVANMNELTPWQFWEGYPSIDVDPVSGRPIYAWHADIDNDDYLEVVLSADLFYFGLPRNPEVVFDNPYPSPPPYNTTNNEFIWPTVKIGPSPFAGKRRVYVLARNYATHTTYPVENVKIAYADFDGDMLDSDSLFVWSYISIPTLDAWNHDTVNYRRPNFTFTVGNDGRLYYIGYHGARTLNPESELIEPDLDAFVCDNYGYGRWTRYTGSSEYPSWSPRDNYGTGDYVFGAPWYPLLWSIGNSSHINAVIDTVNAKIHVEALWGQYYREIINGELSTQFFPTMQTVKDLVFDINTNTFSIREIYPIAGTPVDTLLWLPWDNDGDGLVDEYYTNPDDPNDPDNGYPLMVTTWPFPYWDDTVHSDAMMFHYNNFKISEPNAQGMMAAVWQDCNRARLYNNYVTTYPDLAPYANTPEIWIACSPDYGVTWSEPFSLNKVETPALTGMKPMWVYPADQIKYITTVNNHLVGKLALLFYDDLSWGSFAMDPAVGQNNGGYAKFLELQITFPLPNTVSNTDPVIVLAVKLLKQNYPNPFNPETTISFTMPRNGSADLSIYNVKGQLVKTLTTGKLASGEHKLNWEGTDNNDKPVSSGLYLYKLSLEGRTETRKMMLLK